MGRLRVNAHAHPHAPCMLAHVCTSHTRSTVGTFRWLLTHKWAHTPFLISFCN